MNIKEFLTCIAVVFMMASCSTSNESAGFSIDGQVVNGDSILVKLDFRVDGEWVNIDSAVIEHGSFELSGVVEDPQMAYLRFIEADEVNYTFVFLENTAISIRGDADDVDAFDITGSVYQEEYEDYASGLEKVVEPYDTLYELLALTDEDVIKDSLEQLIRKVEQEEEAYVLDFISAHAASPVAPYVARRALAYYMEYDQLKPVVDEIAASQSGSVYMDQLNEILAKLKVLSIGSQAPDFTEMLVDSTDFNLSSVRGKYVLLDFWASWCGPCRYENPNVVAMYEELGGDDFEIVGISLDVKRDRWLKAIEDDELPWIHVSDLKGWKCAVADLYNVKAIPKTYLLDREGHIIAKNLRGNALKNKIRELLAAES